MEYYLPDFKHKVIRCTMREHKMDKDTKEIVNDVKIDAEEMANFIQGTVDLNAEESAAMLCICRGIGKI